MCPAADQSTFDGNPVASPPITVPYRPGLPDFNDLALEDDAVNPPSPDMPSAALLNAMAAEIIALRRLCQSATVSIKFVSSAPALDSFTAGPTSFMAQTPTAAFTVARTVGGASAGDVTITWPANSLPGFQTRAVAAINGLTPGMISVIHVSNGVRVITQDKTGAGVDLNFSVDIN